MSYPVSVWTSYFYELSLEAAIEELMAGGFNCAELSDEHAAALLETGKAPAKIGAEIKAFADARGFSFPQGHLFLKVNILDDGAADVLKRWLELFEAIGIKSAVLHAAGGKDLSCEERLARRAAVLAELADFLKGTNTVICLENLISADTPRTAEDLLELIDTAGGSEHLGITLDTGHLRVAQHAGIMQSQRDFILKAGSRLQALHIADNDGSGDQHLMPYGRGNVNWNEVMTALKEVGYKYLFNFEIPGERRAPFEILRAKLPYIRKMADYMMTI